jgi:hypothetical protein
MKEERTPGLMRIRSVRLWNRNPTNGHLAGASTVESFMILRHTS